jgi:SAM-dependent methyltransferase
MSIRGRSSLRLPPYERLQPTGPVDWIGRYGHFGPSMLMRRRLRWAADVLREDMRRVLEIGFGSGVFQYELARRAGVSVGIDIHPHAARVRRQLEEDGVTSLLVRGDGSALPFGANVFDAVVLLSSLEFIPEPAACLRECCRVLRPHGRLVCIRPRQLALVDLGFRLLTGVDPETEFAGGRARVEAAAHATLGEAKRFLRPRGWPRSLAPYELLLYETPGGSPHAPAAVARLD